MCEPSSHLAPGLAWSQTSFPPQVSPTTIGSKDHTEGRAPRLPPQGGCRAPQAVSGLLQGALWHHAYLLWASHTGFSCPTSCPTSLSSQGRLQLWERAATWPLTVLNCPQDGGLPGAPAAPRRSWRPGFGCLARVPVLLGLLSWGPPHRENCYGDSPCPEENEEKIPFSGNRGLQVRFTTVGFFVCFSIILLIQSVYFFPAVQHGDRAVYIVYNSVVIIFFYIPETYYFFN